MRTVRRPEHVITLAVLAVLLAASPAGAQSGNWWEEGYQKPASTLTRQVEVEAQPSGVKTFSQTDYVAGETKVCAIGVADHRAAGNMAQARYNAKRAAETVALSMLAEKVGGVYVERSTVVREGNLGSEVVKSAVSGNLMGVEYTPVRYESYPDGSLVAEICAGYNLYGKDGLFGKVIGDVGSGGDRGREDRPPAAATPPKAHTGVVVDASGLKVRPGLAPRILTESGREIYGAMDVPREYALEHGVVGYNSSVEKATATADRIGDNPLVVKALRPGEEGGIDVVISSEDAGKILAADRDSQALSEARVIFVLK